MSETRFCSACGHPNGPEARFCGKCGTPQRAAPAPAPGSAANKTMAAASIDPAELMAYVAQIQEQQRGGAAPVAPPPSPPSAPVAAPPVVAPAADPYATETQLDVAIPADLRPHAAPMKTMLGVSLPELAGGHAPASTAGAAPASRVPVMPAAEPPRGGVPQALPASEAVAPKPSAAAAHPAPASAPQAPAVAARAPARTMLGMFAPPAAGAGAAPVAPSAAGPAAPTVAPMPTAAAPSVTAAPVAGTPPASVNPPIDTTGPTVAAAAGPTPTSPPRRQLGPSHRTMLGVSAPAEALASAQAALDARTQPPPAITAPPLAPMPTGDVSIAGLPSPRRRMNALLVAVLLLGALLVASAVGAYVFFGRGSGRTITVAAFRGEGGERLHVEVPGLPEGTLARFGGASTPFAAGAADLPLAAGALHVGDNPLSIELVLPDGSTETHTVTLTLSYRVRADLAALRETPAAIAVVVEAIPGSTVVLDGESLALDAEGRGMRSYPIEGLTASAEGVIEHAASYTITPPGTPAATGTLATRVPTTTLHVDRPADEAITDRAELELAGTVLAGATLTIEGAPVTVLPEGRFLHRHPLPAPGDFSLRIVASAPEHAPAIRTLRVRRVADLAREAAGFSFDRSLTYARLAAAPTTLVGQRVMYEGRVYNVDLHDGRGVLQMLVRDCPSGARCPLWVSYAAATEVAVDAWVRIYGTIEGEQQFRSTSGEVRTVPSVAAAYVLPSRP